ncbi:MAG: tetratricopeptide repeat protein [Candidatus Gastranaerophilales bacterium]|nr:tetratricopeptide repeat protein [Candidatus Gastranaerophilales bacterium]
MIKCLKIFISILILVLIQAETFYIDPSENAVNHNSYGLFYTKIGEFDAAIQEFKIAIALSPQVGTTASFYNNLGLVYLKIQRCDLAIKSFTIAISMSPNFLDYYVNLVKAYNGKKSLGSLTKNYQKMLNKNNSDYIAWLMLGLIYKEQNKKTEALRCFNEFKKQGPDELLGTAVESVIINMH